MNTTEQQGSEISRAQENTAVWQRFFDTSLDEKFRRSRTIDDYILELFHNTARTVPAYKAFLHSRWIKPEQIVTMQDFGKLPLLTKDNYIHRYALPERCRNGNISANDMIAVSSGSTGEPTFWLRSTADELEIAYRFEHIFRDGFYADTRSTLAVVCFPMGTWVGGMFTAACCRALSAKGYRIALVTPGNNPDEIFRVVRNLSPLFEQTVLLGYPPFIKDVVERGRAQGITWSSYNIKMVFAGEVFSEEWRALVAERTGVANPVCDIASAYGTADAGVLGNETPLSVAIRRYLAAQPVVARELFGESRLPTLVQYDPFNRYFEVSGNTLLFTGDNGIPLVRYHIADTGGVVSFADMLTFLELRGFDAVGAAKAAGAREIRELPFVFVFGRTNFAVSYFGANVYPENIAVGLEQAGVNKRITGKFVLEVQERAGNPCLSVAVELAPGDAGDEQLRSDIAQSVLAHLRRLNSEYAHYVPESYALPEVALYAHGHAEYFPVGIKHRYTRR